MPGIPTTTKREVLRRAKALLKTSHPKYEHRTFIVTGEEPHSINMRDKEFLTVSITGGTFDFGAMVGGTCIPYQGTLRVTLWEINRLDRKGTDESLLLDDNGLLQRELAVICTLFQSHLDEGLPTEENPPDTYDADCILVEPLMPLSDSEPIRQGDETFGTQDQSDDARGRIVIDFGFKIHMDLTKP